MAAKRVAVIPARGGSRRLPRKNLVPFRGKPMIAWTIEASRESGLFDDIILSTEDAEIAQAGKAAGADLLERPASLASDSVPLTQVLVHAINALDLPGDADVCLLMPNCPLRDGRDISETYATHARLQSDVCMSIVSYDWRPPQWALRRTDANWFALVHGRDALTPVVKNDRWVAPSGAIRWVRAERFTTESGFYPERLAGHELPWYRAIDIDEAEDLEMAACVAHAIDSGFQFEDRH